jgi:hypothetical protein
MTRLSNITILIGFLGLTACTTWERHSRSGYSDSALRYNTPDLSQDTQRERMIFQKQLAKQGLGFSKDQALNEEQERSVWERFKLQRLEKTLQTNDEKEQYYLVRPHLASDEERIYFLNLPSFEDRRNYLRANGIKIDSPTFNTLEQTNIEQNDVSPGMRREAVRESWGEPEILEVSGNPILANERWTYQHFVPSPEGYLIETRILIFQSGRLTGWTKNQKP